MSNNKLKIKKLSLDELKLDIIIRVCERFRDDFMINNHKYPLSPKTRKMWENLINNGYTEDNIADDISRLFEIKIRNISQIFKQINKEIDTYLNEFNKDNE